MILDITAELKQNLSLAFILFYRLQAKVTGLHFAPATPQLASVARIRIISYGCFLFFFMYIYSKSMAKSYRRPKTEPLFSIHLVFQAAN